MKPERSHITYTNSVAVWLVALLLNCTAVHAVDRYVSLEGGHVPPFTTWTDAATNIQEAIDASAVGDAIWVTNGVYATGGKVKAGDLTNRVALDKAVTVRSVNGAALTIIQGQWDPTTTNGPAAVRCAWLTNGARLIGFTLQGGATRFSGSADTINGGGAWCGSNAIVVNCLIRFNAAFANGGGVYQGALRNCVVSENKANLGAGVYNATLSSCTVVSNLGVAISASTPALAKLTNCIVYFNTPGNYQSGTFSYCCTTPLPPGVGNISAAPQLLADGFHLAAASPCRGAGTNSVVETDIDGQPWADPPSIGCDEWQSPPVVIIQPAIQLASGVRGFTLAVTVAGQEPFTCWWKRDGMPIEDDGHYSFAHTTRLVVNEIVESDAGNYQVVVSNAFGTVTSAVTQVAIHFVNAAGAAALPPYSSWASAATNIQDAINGASPGAIVLVTNGIYAAGGAVKAGDLTNRVAVDKPLLVKSVNGPFVTTIRGSGAVNGANATRCAWLTDGAGLVGFTLEGGATRTAGDAVMLRSGGGAWCASSSAVIANCVISSNTASSFGSAVFRGSLNTCFVIGNFASLNAPAAQDVVMNSSTVVSNSGPVVSGAPNQTRLTNCILYYNATLNYGGNVTFSYSCTTPLPSGAGNISSAPQLLLDGFHLAATSPCRGAGTNLVSGTDIDDQPWAEPPAIGCDEWRPEPLLISQPIIQPVNAAAGFTINVGVNGQEPFWCLWTRNGVPLDDGANYTFAHTTNLLVRNASLMLDGQFQVVVSNAFGMVTSAVVQLTVHCVDAAGNTPASPFTSWVTAATNIQDAINVAAPGTLVLVTNGVYGTGGKVMAGDLTNRVALDKAIIVHSVNGPAVTIIQGGWDPATTNGPAAVRCAWLTNGATLSGFALLSGATRNSGDSFTLQSGGGIWCVSSNAYVTNCIIAQNRAEQIGAGAYRGMLSACVISNNVKSLPNNNGGGGAAFSVLVNCFITQNFAGVGGGIYQSTATNCAIIRNSANNTGGGSYRSSLYNCTLSENTASSGAGVDWGGLGATINCVLWNNRTRIGGLANYSIGSVLSYCCTSPLPSGSGAGPGNISADPQLLEDGVHLATTSPCRGAGNPLYSSGTDIDCQNWVNPPSIGCDEWQPEPIVVRQPRPRPTIGVGRTILSVSVAGEEPFFYTWSKDGTVLQDGGKYSSTLTPDLVVNEFGLADAGGYQVIISNVVGMATSQVVQVSVQCVDALSTSPTPPYSTWATAAATIQDAIEEAKTGDVVLVTNGIYAAGGKAMFAGLTNRVALDKAVLVTSVNGPEVTIIEGQWDPVSTNGPGAVRCAWMTGEAGLSGFTLRNGATLSSNESNGGGAWCASTNAELANCVITNCSAALYAGGVAGGTLSRCVVVGNAANSAAGAGGSQMLNCVISRNRARFGTGGVDSGLLYNCLIAENTAASLGGGVSYSRLKNCTVVGNSSSTAGGGVASSTTVSNCIIFFNSAPASPNIYASQLNYSCSTPLPVGVGNISADPQLTDGVHLAATSPCRGMGSSLVVTGLDFEGDPWANPPSMGCDEVLESAFAGPLSVALTASYPEVAAYGAMPLNGLVIDRASRLEWSFGDGPVFTNLSYLASYSWPNPGDYTVTFTAYNADNPMGVSTNIVVHVVPLVSPLMSADGLSGTNFSLSFPGQPGVIYVVEQTTNLVPPVTWRTVQSVLSTGALMQVTDTRATNDMRFYRVRTQ